jgi:quercetin dioxygenase-like cupin family protein
MSSTLRVAAAGLVGLAMTLLPATASATPPTGVTGVILAQTTAGGKDYVLREITVQPGGSTGWHFHDGALFAVARQGTLTHNAHDCSVDGVFHTGQAILEPSGADHVHIGRNLGRTRVVLEVRYVNPAGSPLAEDAPNPGCGFE